MFEYERKTNHYMNLGYSRFQAEREAIWDMYGDEIREEERRKKLGLDDEENEDGELTE